MRKISLIRSLKHDYALLVCLLIVVISLGFIGYFFYVEDFVALPFFSILPFVFLVLGFLRFNVLKSYFSSGVYVQGMITDVWFMKDRGRVTYSYEIEGQVYTRGNAIMKTKETKLLVKGKPVDVLVKYDSHNKAIIKHLYA